ncbi:ferrochelatase [Elizabethkingia anophelis]|uniref:ferrochelatase n=1 Tax=Elizabethkingia anophelis TaxID=1117645 RepID=UPI001368A835|nr:ferrochelatase [Elizabethkingia anophelis]MCT3899599.1 ferrochelatase [Elizabethkingia anophelis]MCT4122973.1 ferrochelatase [Elizabethkingia anophelis]MCT4327447.1 ferrochelatase [Elizabethkingia anophelis]MDV3753627.1 ferrochelatase [Elizabethkingia anophelis]MYY43385.1 ferrochelatase [Elizabethkingia anophelis]
MSNPQTSNIKKGILLVNLGSPKSTSVKDVTEYLDEFLMDERVIDIRWLFRSLLVQGIILKTRPKKSAEAYKTVWTDQGSPLIVISEQIQKKLQQVVDVPVALGMRYAQPSIEKGIQDLVDQGVNEIILFPLYPQYAMSTTETVSVKAEEVRKKKFPAVKIKYVKPFYNRDIYINALADSIRKQLPEKFDKLQFSYHGVPERHIYKTDHTKTCNLENCRTEGPHHFNEYCYLNHCYETTRLVREKLGLAEDKVILTFQSRLGKDPWIQPYTDATLESLPKQGVKDLAVVCPAFVSDCLETLEEISEEGKEIFEHAGGKSFSYIPCLNDNDEWIQVMKKLCEELY